MDVRPCEERDLAQLNDLYNHYVLSTPITFDIDPITMDERREWFAGFSTDGLHRLLIALDGERVLGYAQSKAFRPKAAYETTVETTIYVLDGEHGRGVGSSLYSALFSALDGQDLHRAFAGITQPNEASVALHRRFGFTQIGVFGEVGRKFDRYWDVAWYEKAL